MGDTRTNVERVSGRIHERLTGLKDDRGRPHTLMLGGDTGRGRILVDQILDRTQQAMPCHDDAVVRRDEIFFCAIDDRTHAFLQGRVLHRNTCNTAVGAAGFLRFAVDQVIIVLVGQWPERPRHVSDMDALAVTHGRNFARGQRAHGVVIEAPGPAVFIIDRDPEMTVHGVVTPRRDHRERWHDPLRDAPIVVAVLGIAARAHVESAGALRHLEHGLSVTQVVLIALCTLEERISAQLAAVQEGNVARIDAALHRLQPIAFLQTLGRETLLTRNGRKLPLWQGWALVRRPHVGPKPPAAFNQRIGFELDFAAKAAFLRLGRNLDALAGVIILPAMVGTAQAALLVATEPKRYASMRAELIDQTI